jgi:hypothetical protein
MPPRGGNITTYADSFNAGASPCYRGYLYCALTPPHVRFNAGVGKA